MNKKRICLGSLAAMLVLLLVLSAVFPALAGEFTIDASNANGDGSMNSASSGYYGIYTNGYAGLRFSLMNEYGYTIGGNGNTFDVWRSFTWGSSDRMFKEQYNKLGIMANMAGSMTLTNTRTSNMLQTTSSEIYGDSLPIIRVFILPSERALSS